MKSQMTMIRCNCRQLGHRWGFSLRSVWRREGSRRHVPSLQLRAATEVVLCSTNRTLIVAHGLLSSLSAFVVKAWRIMCVLPTLCARTVPQHAGTMKQHAITSTLVAGSQHPLQTTELSPWTQYTHTCTNTHTTLTIHFDIYISCTAPW